MLHVQLEVAESVLHNLIEGRMNVHALSDRAKVAISRNHGIGDFLDKHGGFRTNDVGAQEFCLFPAQL